MNQQICDLIQRRRLQLLIHSRIYYRLNNNIISDKQWDEWAKELVDLQRQYPVESKNTIWHDAFCDWDGSTGFSLPLDDPWVVRKAKQVLAWENKNSLASVQVKQKPIKKLIKKKLRKLF